MERELLQDFIVLYQALSFSEAAEQLNLTQSALSKRIKTLEREVCGPLFLRTTRKIEPSELGLQFLPYARKILTAYQGADTFLQKYHKVQEQKITLATIRNPQYFGIDRIFLQFQKDHPQLQLNLLEEDPSELYHLFQAGKANLFCTGRLSQSKASRGDYEFLAAGRGYLTAILSIEDPFAAKNVLSTKDLLQRKLLLPSPNLFFREEILSQFLPDNAAPNIVYEGGALSSIALLQSGLKGIAIQPVEMTENLPENLCTCRVFPDLHYDYGLGYRDISDLTAGEKKFVKYFQRHFALQENDALEAEQPMYRP